MEVKLRGIHGGWRENHENGGENGEGDERKVRENEMKREKGEVGECVKMKLGFLFNEVDFG